MLERILRNANRKRVLKILMKMEKINSFFTNLRELSTCQRVFWNSILCFLRISSILSLLETLKCSRKIKEGSRKPEGINILRKYFPNREMSELWSTIQSISEFGTFLISGLPSTRDRWFLKNWTFWLRHSNCQLFKLTIFNNRSLEIRLFRIKRLC